MDIGRDARRLGTVEVGGILDEVNILSDADWLADSSRQQLFDAHSGTQTIKLMADSDFRHQHPTKHDMYDRFAIALAPMAACVQSNYSQTLRQRKLIDENGPGYLIRIILTRLPPGAEIRPHIDEGHSLKRSHRIHIPILTNDETLFRVGATTLQMRRDEMWEINNRRIHAVRNDGAEPRVHLIIDYVQPGEVVFDAEGPLTA